MNKFLHGMMWRTCGRGIAKENIMAGLIVRLTACCVVLNLLFISRVSADESQKPLILYKPYMERQTFSGRAYYKDNNVWVYTSAFAKTFGMPPENIYELKGIEAAAFRVEDMGFKDCGMGGKDENCRRVDRCVTDVYIDESKYPLPWATDRQADYHAYYDSTQWLATSKEIAVMPATPNGVIGQMSSRWASLHPFADPQTHDEVLIGHNGNVPKNYESSCGGGQIYGYKRGAIAGLTMISLGYSCMPRNEEKPEVTFRFHSCKKEGYNSLPLKQFHEFVLPNVFERKIDAALQESTQRMRDYAKKLLNLK